MERILILGAGLAGTCLAHQLLRRGQHVHLIDSGENHSSSIAAGMVNPMVFRRMNKSWRLDEFLPEAQAFYQEISQEIGEELYHPIVIRRFFSSLYSLLANFGLSTLQDPIRSFFVIGCYFQHFATKV